MNVVERSTPSPGPQRPPARASRSARRGQVCVAGKHAYVGHIPNKDHLGTSIVDISDPANPRVVATITLDDHTSHSHKARVVGDIMIVNHERNPTAIGRRADELPRVMKELTAAKGRAPTHAEIATWLGVEPADVARDRGGGEARLSQRRLQGLRRLQPGEAEGDRAPQDRRHRRAPLRYGRALRLHLDRDGGLCRQHPRHLRHARSGEAAGGVALVDAGPAHRRRRDADLARAASTGCIMRCASATRCGRAAGTAASASSTCPTSSKPKTQGRLQLSPAVPGADAHRDAGAGADQRQAHRARDRRGGSGAERQRGADAARAGRMPAS